MIVTISVDDIDLHGAGCDCGLCNINGKSYGAAILDPEGEVIERIYAPSEDAALENARLVCKERGYEEGTQDDP